MKGLEIKPVGIMEGGSETPSRRDYYWLDSPPIRSHSAPASKDGGSSERGFRLMAEGGSSKGTPPNSLMCKPPTGATNLRRSGLQSKSSSQKRSSTSGEGERRSRDSRHSKRNSDGQLKNRSRDSFLKDSNIEERESLKPPANDFTESISDIKNVDSNANDTALKGVWESNHEGSAANMPVSEVPVVIEDGRSPLKPVEEEDKKLSIATFSPSPKQLKKSTDFSCNNKEHEQEKFINF